MVEIDVGRLERGLRRHGVRGFVPAAARLGLRRLYSLEAHVWYELPLGENRPSRPLADGLELVRGTVDDVPALVGLWPMDRWSARRRMQDGATLWLVREGESIAFSCWIFEAWVPFRAAAGGKISLPAGTVALDESATAESHRGRGVAPAAWAAIADRLPSGADRLVTPVDEENVPSRRAVEKVGFREFARTVITRRLTTELRVDSLGGDASFLAEALTQ